MSEPIYCFTDASYSQQKQLSIVGYKIGTRDIQTEVLANVKNTQAELYAIQKCIEISNTMFPSNPIIIYTDCQRAIKSYEEHEYPLHVTITKIKGHMRSHLRNETDAIFHSVDRAVRKALRLA